jgi:hypothetical protein
MIFQEQHIRFNIKKSKGDIAVVFRPERQGHRVSPWLVKDSRIYLPA